MSEIEAHLKTMNREGEEGKNAQLALRQIWDDSPDALLAILRDGEPLLRARAADALGLVGDKRAVPALMTILEGDRIGGEADGATRGRIANALGQIGDWRATEPLLQLLADENLWLRWAAADALGHLGDPAALDPLFELWATTNQPAILDVVRGALLRIGKGNTHELANRLHHPIEAVQAETRSILEEIDTTEARELLNR